MQRKIYDDLLAWKSSGMNKALMVVGARQVGKTYIIREFCEKEFEQNIYINLFEHSELINIFKKEISVEEKFNMMKIYLDIDIDLSKTIIFFDEIQESEELISALKYFNESDKPFKIICAGSLLGVKLKRMSTPFPVGKVKILNMFPMDFEEFLIANNNMGLIEEIKKCFYENSKMDSSLHNKALDLYRLYLCVGGMPEAVKNIFDNNKDILKFDRSIVEDIIVSYLNDMSHYVNNKNEAVKIKNIYKSIPSQLGNQSNKFQYSKVSADSRRRDYETALEWLLSSNLIYKCSKLNKVEIPLLGFINNEHFKLYLNDVGILVSMLGIKFNDIILDNLSLYKGVITENFVANQIFSNDNDLIYWESNNSAELDFVIYNNDGIIPVEVKANDNVHSKSLKTYMEKYNPKYAVRISTKNFGFENNIKSVPLYATFLIK